MELDWNWTFALKGFFGTTAAICLILLFGASAVDESKVPKGTGKVIIILFALLTICMTMLYGLRAFK